MLKFIKNYEKYDDELTPKQVADILGFTTTKLYLMLAREDCPICYFKFESRYVIPKEYLRDYIISSRHGGKKTE